MHFLLKQLSDISSHFLQIWNHIFKTVFPKLFFLFSIRWSIFRKIFFSKTYSSLIWNDRLAPKVTFEPYRWEESGIFLGKVSRFLAFSRKWVGNHFYMAKWTLIYGFGVTCYLWHLTSDTWHVTYDLGLEVNILRKFHVPSSYGLGGKVFWSFRTKGSPNHLIIELQRCL